MSLRYQIGRKAPFICPSCRVRLEATSHVPAKLNKQQKRWITRDYIRKIRTAEEDWLQRAQAIEQGQKKSILDFLEERGYINQIVGTRDELNQLLTYRRAGIYAGIDPTAPSMHVGHMVPYMALSWLYVHGFQVYFLLGGATSRIGDPTGRLTGRDVLDKGTHNANVASMHMQLKRFGQTMEQYAAKRGYAKEWAWHRALVNNSTWYQKQTLVEFLRVMGSRVRIGPMLGRDTVKNRMEAGDGMSFSEFTYPLVQAWDWWELYQKGVQVQIGGADQFGNILAGAEAVKSIAKNDVDIQDQQKRAAAVAKTQGFKVTEDPLGFTVPLLTTATGEKFGKSAGNAVWLDADMTSTFDLYQFFLRSADADVEKFLKLLTFLPMQEISQIMETHRQDESKRIAQHKLAKEFVELVHGYQAAQEAEAAHRQLFKRTLSLDDIKESVAKASSSVTPEGSVERPPAVHPLLNKHAQAQTLHSSASTNITLPRSLVHGEPLSRILYAAGLVASRSEGHRLVKKGGVYIGGRPDRKGALDDALTYTPAKDPTWASLAKYIIDDKILILRTGKWKVKIISIIPDTEFEAAGLTCPGWQAGKGTEVTPVEAADIEEEQSLEEERQTAETLKEQSRYVRW